MPRGVTPKNHQIVEALEKAAGIITVAAQMLGMRRECLSRRISKTESLQGALKAIEERTLDLAEGQLLKSIKNGNLTAVIFFLKTKGMRRGYAEKRDVYGEMEVSVHEPAALKGKSDAELMKIVGFSPAIAAKAAED